MEAIVFGTTGLCGSEFMKYALNSDSVSRVWGYSRRANDVSINETKLTSMVSEADNWGSALPTSAAVAFSGVATTRAAAGGIDSQYKTDHDLQLELAKAAKSHGVHTMVIVSSAGADPQSRFAYLRMKGELDRDVEALKFPKTIILRPGLLLGHESPKGFGSGVASSVGRLFHRTMFQPLGFYSIEGSEVAAAAFKAVETLPDGVHILGPRELLKLSAKN